LDNVTHCLAGMLVAEAALVWRRESRQELRAAAYLVSALANNLPDIDVVYSSWLTRPKPIGSLVHHRGHTHTLALALPMAWLLGVWLWCRFSARNPGASRGDQKLILGLSLLGPLLHLTMDFGNNYGVHPFWPLSSRWYYGDTIFIVEPLWFAASIPILAQIVRAKWLKILLWVALGVVLVLTWFVPFVLPASRFAIIALTVLAFVIGKRASERARVAFAAGVFLIVAATFAVASQAAKAQLGAAAEAAFPALQVNDIAASPMPANPCCWEALMVGEQSDVYRVVRASVALWPLRADDCTAGLDVEPTAPVRRLERPDRGGVRWIHEYSAELADLRRRVGNDCRFRALLQFARVPYAPVHVRADSATEHELAGDLRYDRHRDRDFSDVPIFFDEPMDPSCPAFLPGWEWPRAELFR
jgi:inner membrane protein